MRNLIFWDVDTQYDFIMPDGKLYVPRAETILENLSRLTEFARKQHISIYGSVDYHRPSDQEISDHPDFQETFPPHCLQGTPGQEKVPSTKPLNPLWIENYKYDRERLENMVERHSGEIIFRKQKFDVFSNPNLIDFLEITRPTDVVLYGVALDVCDAHAIEGFLRLGSCTIYLVRDAVKAIYEEKGSALLEDWSKRGVKMLDTADVEKGIQV